MSIIQLISMIALCSIGPTLFTSTAHAEDIRYISDSVPVEMRSGPSNGYRIKAWPTPGTKLTLLDAIGKGDWIKVVTAKGTEGWVLQQHLSEKRASKHLLEEAKNRILTLEKEKLQQSDTITALQNELSQIKSENTTLANKNTTIENDYSSLKKISNNAIMADKSNKDLRKKTELFKIKIEELTTDNERLKHDRNVEGITTGMLAVALGGLMAFAFMRLGGQKRRSSGWD